jgi:lipopolysaccharide assembly protein B
MLQLLLLLLPVAAVISWFAGYRHRKAKENESVDGFVSPEYFLGLNYLINDEPDKAVDVFIKMLEVNSNTIETHLALGNLFRRRGEVDRAIRIHQNLIARPRLAEKERRQAMVELAQDYLRAGVLDRAERLFLELIAAGSNVAISLTSLINIYQLEKDWEKAIATAKKVEDVSKTNMQLAIAHYYCELADVARNSGRSDDAKNHIKHALKHDKKCARASIILGQIYFAANNFGEAIKAFQMVDEQDPEFGSEVIGLLYQSYTRLNKEGDFVDYLTKRIEEYPRSYYILVMSDYLQDKYGDEAALDYLAKFLPHSPSLPGLKKMLSLYVNRADDKMKGQLLFFGGFIDKLIKSKPLYRCVHCGFSGKSLYWQCPSCRRWNLVKPIHSLEGD